MIKLRSAISIPATILVITGLVFGSSCKKLLKIDPPANLLSENVVFNNDKSAISAMAGLYSTMIQTNLYFGNSAMTIFPGLSSDEIYNTIPGVYAEFSMNAVSVSNSAIDGNLWRAAYNYIYQANAIIKGLEQAESVSASVRKQLTGEAKFVRAFCHFYLANLFGDIPLIRTTDYTENVFLPRTAKSEVYRQVTEDLLAARDLLEKQYPNGEPTRPNKWAAAALLARVYLYREEYALAEAAASEVISAASYSLLKDLSKVFLAKSPEAIWQLGKTSGTINTFEGNMFIPAANQVPKFPVSSFLLDAFEPGDLRKTQWLSSVTINGTVYYYPFKYRIRTSTNYSEYYNVLRYAELFLIRAEARARQNNITGSQEDLNEIRARAGLPATQAATVPELLEAIQRERQVELFAEWGHRWFDLKRTGRADQVLGTEKGANWQPEDALYPIPSTQIIYNKMLVQNPGY